MGARRTSGGRFDADLSPLQPRFQAAEGRRDHLLQRVPLLARLQAARLQPRQVQEIPHEPAQPVRLLANRLQKLASSPPRPAPPADRAARRPRRSWRPAACAGRGTPRSGARCGPAPSPPRPGPGPPPPPEGPAPPRAPSGPRRSPGAGPGRERAPERAAPGRSRRPPGSRGSPPAGRRGPRRRAGCRCRAPPAGRARRPSAPPPARAPNAPGGRSPPATLRSPPLGSASRTNTSASIRLRTWLTAVRAISATSVCTRELPAHGVECRRPPLPLPRRLGLLPDPDRQRAHGERHDEHHREGDDVPQVGDIEIVVRGHEEEVERHDAGDGGQERRPAGGSGSRRGARPEDRSWPDRPGLDASGSGGTGGCPRRPPQAPGGNPSRSPAGPVEPAPDARPPPRRPWSRARPRPRSPGPARPPPSPGSSRASARGSAFRR